MPKPKIPFMTQVEVVWDDARSGGGWLSYDEIDSWRQDFQQRVIHTQGWLWYIDKKAVVLVMSRDEKEGTTSMAHSVLEIPRPMVRAIYAVKRGKKLA